MSHILMFTPLLPCPTGGGSAIRASAELELLAEYGRVIVVHCDYWGGDTLSVADASWCRQRAAAVLMVDPARLQQVPDLVADCLAAEGSGASIDLIHVFRQILAPIGLKCRERFSPRATFLDLDDDECARNRQFVPLYERAGYTVKVAAMLAEEQRAQLIRSMFLPRYDRVFLSNEEDCAVVHAQQPTIRIELLPNVVRPVPPLPGITADPHRMLYIGRLDYLPNEDAIHWFVGDMLPAIRAADPRFRLRVAGIGLPDTLRPSLVAEGVDFVGAVREVGPEFAAAGMLVVPLRAGSGTRIKILEAFRHGTPVISTSIGAAGLNVTDGEHLLLADSAEAMTAACLRLAGDTDLRARLASAAAAWVEKHHSLDAMRQVFRQALGEPSAPEGDRQANSDSGGSGAGA